MMAEQRTCSSYRPESGMYGLCADGFPQTGPCMGFALEVSVPICCSEKVCGRSYPNTGEPFSEYPHLRRAVTTSQSATGDERKS